jgi:hypothetical protein
VKRAELAFEQELTERLFARSQPLAIQDREPSQNMCGADMEVNRLSNDAMGDPRSAATDARIDAVRRRMQRRVEHPIAPLDPVLRDLGANEIERAALPCRPKLRGGALGMEPADASSDAGRREKNLVADSNLTGEHGPSDDRPSAGQHEAAVDREAKATTRGARRIDPTRFVKPRFKCRDAAPGDD